MFGLFRSDVDLDEFADEPRWFIEGLLRGEPDELAAERAGVSLEDVRQWAGDRKFRHALKRARNGIGRTTVAIDSGRPVDAPPDGGDLLVILDADGQVAGWKSVTECFACRVGGCTVHTGKRPASDPSPASGLFTIDKREGE
jgi:hypothetical protein